MTRDWRACLPFLPAALLFGVLYGPVLFAPAGHAPATHDADFYLYYFPMTQMAFDMWREGTFPLWNPYIYSGMPLLPSLEIGILYPPNWLHLILSTERAFCLLYVIHILLAGSGMYWYVRGRCRTREAALLSALAYTFAAPTILHFDMGLTSVVYSSAWVPLLLALIDRSLRDRGFVWMSLLVLALACQFLAGFPMFTLLLALLIPAYLLCFGIDWSRVLSRNTWSIVLWFGAAAILALGLVAPQLLPTWQHLLQAHRTELGYAQATHCSFPAINLLTVAAPAAFGDDRFCRYWGELDLFDVNAFCGVTTLVLAGLALVRWRRREVLFWAMSVLLIVAFSLGKDSAFYDLCFLFLPVVDWFRGISRLMIFANLGLALLAGIGFEDALTATRRRGLTRYCMAIGVLAAAGLTLAVTWQMLASPPRWWIDLFDWVRRPGREVFTTFAGTSRQDILELSFARMSESLALSMLAMLLVSVAIVFLTRRRLVGVGILSLLAWELFAFNGQYIAVMDTAPWGEMARRIESALPPEAEPYRVAIFNLSPPVPANRLLYRRLETVGGHENFLSERYSAFLYKWSGIHPKLQTYLSVPDDEDVYDFLNVKYYLVPSGRWTRKYDALIARNVFDLDGTPFDMYRNEGVLARVLLAHQAQNVSGLEVALENIPRLHELGVKRGTVVERRSGMRPPDAQVDLSRESVHIRDYAPGRIVAEVHCEAPALVVFIENFDEGWQATVDGDPAAVFPANAFMTAVDVPAGEHVVALTYRPRSFILGLKLAGLSGLILVLGWLTLLWRRSRAFPGTHP